MWGHLKPTVSKEKNRNLKELKGAIRNKTALINLGRVEDKFRERIFKIP